MTWDRQTSALEEMVVKALRSARKALTLNELVEMISESDQEVLTGKSPTNSLYSIIYRRELRRARAGAATRFNIKKEGRVLRYSLNLKSAENK